MIQIDRETFQMMLHQIMERFDKIEDRLNRMNRLDYHSTNSGFTLILVLSSLFSLSLVTN
jgi:hypothetical protein